MTSLLITITVLYFAAAIYIFWLGFSDPYLDASGKRFIVALGIFWPIFVLYLITKGLLVFMQDRLWPPAKDGE